MRRTFSAAMLLLIVSATVAALLVLKHTGECAVEAERDLRRVESALYAEDALGWKLLSGRYLTVEIAPAISERQIEVHRLLARAAGEGVSGANATWLRTRVGAYGAALRHEVELVSAGRRLDAQYFNELSVKPAFAEVRVMVTKASAAVATHGRVVRRSSDLALVAVVVLAVGSVAGIERRRRRIERRRRAEVAHQAKHDSLTGLPNRLLFFDRLRDAVARAGWNGAETSLLYIDLDDFKTINDTLGHGVGDDILVIAAERMESALRSGHLLARLGGDEFAVLLEGTRPEEAAAIADRLAGVLGAEVSLAGTRIQLSASIGLAALSDVDRETGAEIGLLAVADLALYAAKAEGKARCLRYRSDMAERAQRRRVVEAGLRAALDGTGEDRLAVVYQPVVRVADGEIRSVEALCRFTSAALGAVPPVEFIPLAEETGLIVRLGQWVLDEACTTVAGWIAGGAAVALAVNVSARQLDDDDFVTLVDDVLQRTGIEPGSLTLEITESQAVGAESLPTLHALKGLGVRLAVDDFGTGYASLAQLEMLPLDVVKIDRSFVVALEEGGPRSHIVTGVLRLAADLGLEAVAEGVETVEQRQALLRLGCPLAQGFLYSRPLPPEDMRGMLARSLVAEVRA